MTKPQFQSLKEGGGGCGSKHHSVHHTKDWVKGKQGAWAILTHWGDDWLVLPHLVVGYLMDTRMQVIQEKKVKRLSVRPRWHDCYSSSVPQESQKAFVGGVGREIA